MKKRLSTIICFLLVLSLIFPQLGAGYGDTILAVKKPVLSQTSTAVCVGKTTTLKIKNKVKGAKYTWKSSKKVASVSSKGKIKGLKKGNTTITCQVKSTGKSYSLKCKVTVVKAASGVEILNEGGTKISSLTIKPDTTYQLKGVISPSSSNDVITWSSSNKGYVKVSSKGKLTAVNPGVATITAKTVSNKKTTVTVSVTAAIGTNLYQNYQNDFKIGAAINTWQLKDAAILPLIKEQFNSITMENEMKPESLLDGAKCEATNDVQIKEENLGTILKLAQQNNLKLRGHCLVWHSQTPEWFFHEGFENGNRLLTKDEMIARMDTYIKKVIQYCQTNYPGVVYCWDVVNEAISDGSGTYRETSNWYKTIGSEYIKDAFVIARKYADKDVKLFYNDYSCYNETKREKIYNVVSDLKKENLVDGIGMQSHWSLTNSYPSVSLVEAAIDRFSQIPGIELQLTEVDANTYDNSVAGNNKLADYYKSMFEMLLRKDRNKQANITAVTFWGLSDNVTWLSTMGHGKSYPLLFDDNVRPKTAYYKLLELK